MFQISSGNEKGALSVPFLQYFNTWRDLPNVKKFVTSQNGIADLARTLLDVPNIKLYQDSLFHKRYNDGSTPWHSDARMAPFDTSTMITVWIPLQDIPCLKEGGTGLMFVDKSHSDFALPFWNRVPRGDIGTADDYEDLSGGIKFTESREFERLGERYSYGNGDNGVKHYMPMKIGDCTVHAGWTLHSSAGVDFNCETMIKNKKSCTDRYALAVTYVDATAEIRQDAILRNSESLSHEEDRMSYESWIYEVKPRTHFEHPFVPTIFR